MTEMEARLAERDAQLACLRAENEQLRRSAQAFGELAERLNRALLRALDGAPTASARGVANAHPCLPAPPGMRTKPATMPSSVTVPARR